MTKTPMPPVVASPSRSARATLRELARIPGGRRFALSAAVESLTSGLLRPFVVIYAVTIGLDVRSAGIALTAGMLVGLATIPLVGRWIDTGARRAPSAFALLTRAAGTAILVLGPSSAGFAIGAALIGIGTQVAPPANNALIAALAGAEHRATALAAGRSIRNAGLGLGALLATVLVAGGSGAIRWLALVTALGCGLGALVLTTVPLHPVPRAKSVERTAASTRAAGRELRPVTVLALLSIPFAFCADVLEIALPVTLVQTLHASPAWSSGVFVANTVIVIALQVVVVVRLSNLSQRAVLAASGVVLAGSYLGFWLGAAGGGLPGVLLIAVVVVPYTVGEILYTGSGVPLVIESVPEHLIGRALARWQLSYGLARALDPVIITGLLSLGAGALWAPLAALTLLAAVTIAVQPVARDGRYRATRRRVRAT